MYWFWIVIRGTILNHIITGINEGGSLEKFCNEEVWLRNFAMRKFDEIVQSLSIESSYVQADKWNSIWKVSK